MAVVELIWDFLGAYGVGNVVVLFSYLFEWKHSFVVVVGFASRGENEHFQLHLRAGIWQELSGTFVVSLRAKCISLFTQINHTSLTRRRDAYRVQTSSEATVCLTSPDFNSTRDETKCLDVCQLLLICMCTLCYITIR